MTDEDEIIIEEPPVVETPAWDYGQYDEPAPPAPPVLTAEQIRDIIREETRRDEHEPDYEETLIEKAVSKAATMMRQEMAQVTAPAARRDLVEEIAIGLDAPAKQYLNDYLQSYDANTISAIKQDKKTMDMLRRAAEFENVRGKSTKDAPRSEGTQTVTEHFDSAFESELDALWRGGFNQVPGMTKEKFREEMKRRTK